MNICVFCSSSDKVSSVYFSEAEKLGELIGERGDTLVYGGANVGLMGALARSVHKNNGKVVGVIPDFLKDKEIAFKQASELIVTDDMRDRKTIMEKRSDGFIVLPGGFGTLEEAVEILTLKLLRQHKKPLVFVNKNGFYDGLLGFFKKMVDENVAKLRSLELYDVVDNAESAISCICAVDSLQSNG